MAKTDPTLPEARGRCVFTRHVSYALALPILVPGLAALIGASLCLSEQVRLNSQAVLKDQRLEAQCLRVVRAREDRLAAQRAQVLTEEQFLARFMPAPANGQSPEASSALLPVGTICCALVDVPSTGPLRVRIMGYGGNAQRQAATAGELVPILSELGSQAAIPIAICPERRADWQRVAEVADAVSKAGCRQVWLLRNDRPAGMLAASPGARLPDAL